jgi:hypothetical protein
VQIARAIIADPNTCCWTNRFGHGRQGNRRGG